MKLRHSLTGKPYEALFRAARLASALCIGVYVLFLYLTSRQLLPDPFTRLTSVTIGAFIPQVTFIGSYTNDDAFSMAVGALVLYSSARLLLRGLTIRGAAFLGLSLGLLALSKLNYYMLFVVFGVFAIARLRLEYQLRHLCHFLASLSLVFALAALLSGWWFVRGLVLYNDLFGAATLYRNFRRVAPRYQLHTLAGQGMSFMDMLQRTPWVSWSFESFWGRFDYMTLPLSDRLYGTLTVICFACVAGVMLVSWRYLLRHLGLAPEDRLRALIWVVSAGLVVGAITLSAWTSYTNDFQAQGRYFFPALVPITLLLAVGVQAWSARLSYRAIALSTTGLAMVALNLYCLLFVIVPTYHYWSG